ncbi:hypothetical protein BXQ17_06585 [Polaribacter sp. BM10]|uniref:hypothetical protein n=1 Tax=Polaribacter sp. BM10 TaxID=1529069 RepID=UPI00098BC26F|nr:hypothetical protein [Polaribacter sp. BM10]AQS93744.1 hypothetical protein BXQ17_06585 [Polaribacter sp. BM10]
MIKLISRKNINIDKYDDCIKNSIQSRIYAFSWYLDTVSKNWSVLVLNDYEAVLPISWQRKLFFKYSSQPYFSQQLGVFSKDLISKEIQKEFLSQIPVHFFKVVIHFNSQNYSTENTITLKNYKLTLNTDYVSFKKNFSKGRKHAIKVGEKALLYVEETTIAELIKIHKDNYSYKISYKVLTALSNAILRNRKGFLLGVFKDEQLLGGALFTDHDNRITYLFAAFTVKGKTLQASSFLLSEVIKKYQNSNLILDFEGGNMPSIAKFYRSFGAEEENYFAFKRTLL